MKDVEIPDGVKKCLKDVDELFDACFSHQKTLSKKLEQVLASVDGVDLTRFPK